MLASAAKNGGLVFIAGRHEPPGGCFQPGRAKAMPRGVAVFKTSSKIDASG
jgi:hypothetical protein